MQSTREVHSTKKLSTKERIGVNRNQHSEAINKKLRYSFFWQINNERSEGILLDKRRCIKGRRLHRYKKIEI